MERDRIDRIRTAVMFVIAWLIALYVYKVVLAATDHGGLGFGAAALVWGINLYARRRAAACVEGNRLFRFWHYVPMIVFLVVPLAIKIIQYFVSDQELRWWNHIFALLPFMLQLGVPAGVLGVAYVMLGRLLPPGDDAKQTGDEPPKDQPAET